MNAGTPGRVAVVAIAKDEDPFVPEWLAYHRLIGADHIFLYDDDPRQPLRDLTQAQRDFVTVVPWHGRSEALTGRNRQTKAYWHARCEFGADFAWLGYVDLDEFVVLRDRPDLRSFLSDFADADSVTLNWHVFGHSGYYDDPPGLVTAHLTRRMAKPSPHGKSFTRPSAIGGINSAHTCQLVRGSRHVDGNGRPYSPELYPGRSDRAHINHYQCRSFRRWMKRVERGCVTISSPETAPAEHRWRIEQEDCLRKFVETVALDKNEFVDTYMLRYRDDLTNAVAAASAGGFVHRPSACPAR